MMYGGPGWGWVGMIFGGLMMLLFLGILVALAVFAIRAFSRSGNWQSSSTTHSTGQSKDNALAILKERYARGEIDKDQYERIKADLLA